MASAQYRPGLPEVLVPEPSPNAVRPSHAHAAGALQAAYARAGRPRVALFWNVELTDQLEDARGARLRTIDQFSERSRRDQSSVSRTVETVADTRVDVMGRRNSPLREADEWTLVSAFEAGLRDAGLQLVDRAAIARLASARAGGGADSRLIETRSLLEMADLVLEVLHAQDAGAAIGVVFRGVLRDIRSGRVLGSFLSRGVAEAAGQAPSFRPSPAGFERIESAKGPESAGRALATDALIAMVPALSGWEPETPAAAVRRPEAKRPAAGASRPPGTPASPSPR